jgi:hypothetical protein
MTVTGGYVRHRDRMVQESVFQDLQNTLIACRWMAGTTTREVVSPYDISTGYQVVTTTLDQTLRLLGTREDGTAAQVVLIDYFPEVGGNDDAAGTSRKTEPNTMAVDTGVPQDSIPVELGSNMEEKPYVFTLAFYAASDAVALAVMNDLRDRYMGRLVTDDHLDLFNFNDSSFNQATTDPVVRMEIDYFQYQRNSDLATPANVHLYFAELGLTDTVDSSQAT